VRNWPPLFCRAKLPAMVPRVARILLFKTLIFESKTFSVSCGMLDVPAEDYSAVAHGKRS